MEITVNKKNHRVPETCSITLLLSEVLCQPPNGLAVAINQSIIPKISWENHLLQSGDQVIIIKATPGG
ncbi:sulfur carrier protein ThiS [Pedobacter immunditicola]|uniref:sulfur carrier protein ThiS n=1 Tax=Pedobacter immunditicola TaxID=3133440 RepID=UPI00309DAC57